MILKKLIKIATKFMVHQIELDTIKFNSYFRERAPAGASNP